MIRSALYSKGLLTPSSVPWRGYPLSPRLITCTSCYLDLESLSQSLPDLAKSSLSSSHVREALSKFPSHSGVTPTLLPTISICDHLPNGIYSLASSTDSKAIISVGHKISPQERFSEGKSLCPQFPMSLCRLIHAYVYKTLVLYFKCWRHNRDCLLNNLSPSLLLLPAFI